MKKILYYVLGGTVLVLILSIFAYNYEKKNPRVIDNEVYDDYASYARQQHLDSLKYATELEIIQQRIKDKQSLSTNTGGSFSPDDAYALGYSYGMAHGEEDARNGNYFGQNYDDSNEFYDYYEERYTNGYEEGYTEGYNSEKNEE